MKLYQNAAMAYDYDDYFQNQKVVNVNAVSRMMFEILDLVKVHVFYH